MKISAKQQLFLFRVLQDTVSKHLTDELSITYAERLAMLDTLVNQQDNKLYYVDDLKKK